jgi:hypothetical protein
VLLTVTRGWVAGAIAANAASHLREQERPDRVARREAQPVLAGGPLGMERLGGTPERQECLLGVGVERAAGCRGLHPRVRAREQGDTDAALKALQALGDGRLGQGQRVGCGADCDWTGRPAIDSLLAWSRTQGAGEPRAHPGQRGR